MILKNESSGADLTVQSVSKFSLFISKAMPEFKSGSNEFEEIY